jgi:8-oxo-dGTP diphosphatase
VAHVTGGPDQGPPPALVLAAGGIPWRRVEGGLEVLLVHRPKYDDWSFPKGKLDDGESAEDGALREVREETGLRCGLGPELATVAYEDGRGRPKQVRYWALEPRDGEFVPGTEVDEIRWVPPAQAAALLTYDHDRDLLDAFDVDAA